MDVRQFAFLALQPSAAVKDRERFLGMPKRGVAFLLANVMFWQPMWAQADGIVVANPGTSLGQAGNGVPIVNIATPNGTGLSHNQFHDYNVGGQGVILNNSASQTTPTQLGGIIVGNPNLKNSGSAQAILNEVISGNPSQLRGYTEVAGQSARVIVANPYGITCNGCGFINSPRVTLTTGKPVLDNGRLDRFQVDQGSVAIEGAGLNATNVDRFEIITRSAKINAQLQAQNLTIVAGRNDVDAQTLNATARADDGSAKPQLAIDSSALGGMYAGAIKLVGTEAGVGVKLAGNLAASGGDIQIDANGQLTLAQTSAASAVNIKANSLDAQGPVYAGSALKVQTQGGLNNQQSLAARDSISLSAGGTLSNSGIIEAGVNADNSRNSAGDVNLSAQNLNNSGKSVIASRNLTADVGQTLSNQGGTLNSQNTRVTASTLDNQNKGNVLGNTAVQLNAGKLLNSQGVITSNGNVTADIGDLNNHDGEISSAGSTRITAITLDNSDGQVTGDVALNIGLIGALNNRNGVLGSGVTVNINAASLDNSLEGSLVSDGILTARITGLFDNQNGDLSAKGVVDLQTGSLDNRNGSVIGKDRLTLRSDSLDNRTGKVRAAKDLQLTVGTVDNSRKGLLDGQAAVNYSGTQLDNRGGLLSAAGPMTLGVTRIDNSTGRISSKTDLTANVAQFVNQGGELVAQGTLSLAGQSLDNRSAGLVGATKALKLTVDDIDNRGGEISSAVDVTLAGQSLNNSDKGKILAGTQLGLTVARVINQTLGQLYSKGATTLVGQSLDNSGGRFVADQGLDIRLDKALSNIEGLVSTEGTLTVHAATFDNSRGNLSSAGALALTTTGILNNQGGSMTTDNGLTLESQSLDNSQNALISSKNAAAVTTGEFNNTAGGRLISGDTLDLNATEVSNGTGSRIASEKALTAVVTGFDQQGGQLFSKTSLILDLNHGQLNNLNGLINAPLLVLKNLKDINNQGGEISSAQAFTLTAQNLDNGTNGKLISNQGLTLRIEQLLASVKGLISGQTVEMHSARLDNSGGLITSRGTLGVTVDGQLVNQGGTLIADGEFNLAADSLDNSDGHIAGKSDVIARVASLDNQRGELVATAGLTLTGASLDNRKGGLVGANQALQLNVDAVDNRGGELSSQAGVTLIGSRLDNSDGGKVVAQDALTLTVDEVLNRAKGLLSGKTGLTLTGGSLDSTGGSLLTQKNLTLELTGDLNNSQGLISAEGTLTVTAASLINTLASVSVAGPLTLTTTGAVLNQGGEIVTDAGLNLVSASLDNSNKGSISGKGSVLVHTGTFDNSHKGKLNSGDTLDLKASQVTNQDGGRIASVAALTANVTGLDQQGGELFSNASLELDLNHGQLNNRNGLINAPLLMLKNLQDVNNDGGEISSAQAFTVAARSLDNSNGKLLGSEAVTLRIDQALINIKGLIAAAALDIKGASLDNSGGTLTSRSNLLLNLDGLLTNQNLGLINATTDLTLNSGGLNNQNGSLLGSAIAIDFGAATGDLNNDGGLITTAGQLSIQHLRDVTNRSGEISSSQSIDLKTRAFDNSGGKLISSNLLNLTGTQLQNQNGLISGWQGLDVNADSLDNRNSGTLSSKNASLSVTLSGDLLNSGAGALVSQKGLSVNAASLDNSNNGVVSSGEAQILTLSGLLNNAAGGSIYSGSTLAMQAMTLGNAGGSVSAKQDLSFVGTTVDNIAGTLASDGAVTLDLLGALTNTNGKLASGGALLLQRATQINNQGGQLASQGLMTLLSGGLDNRNRGTVAANDLLTITTPGGIQNSADGLIYSQNGDVHIQAASLGNAKGTLQSKGAMTLATSSDIDNQSGRIIADAGDLTLDAGNLDSRGGVLASLKGAFSARLTGVLKNGYDLNNNRQGGVIQAQRMNLTAPGGIDNYGGRISAQSGDVLITTGNFDNRNGGLYAKGKINVTGNTFDNSGDSHGQIAGQQIDLSLTGALNNRLGIIESDTSLSIKAASLDNQTGQLRALGSGGKTSFQIGGLFDNRNGTLETANSDLTLGASSFLNAGGSLLHVGTGTFDISTHNVINAGGTVVTRGGLTISTDNWTNSNVIQAGRLTVNVNSLTQTATGQLLASDSFTGSGINWLNEGLIASDGRMNVGLSGAYWGGGRLSSLGTLGLSAAQVSLNSATSSIAGGGDTTLNVGGRLDNGARLTSAANMTINAGAINNWGTLAAGQNLTATTGSLINSNALITSGGDMRLQVANFNNSYGQLYGLANVYIGGDAGTGKAGLVDNVSGDIYSARDLTINALTVNNVRAILEYTKQEKSSVVITQLDCNLIPIAGCDFRSGSRRNGLWEIAETDRLKVSASSAAASLTSGGNLSINASTLNNTSSTIASTGNIVVNADTINNTGLQEQEIVTKRTYWNYVDQIFGVVAAVDAFNRKNGGTPSPTVEADLSAVIGMMGGGIITGPKTSATSSSSAYDAVIQAVGNITLNAGQTISNSVVRPFYAYVAAGRTKADTGAGSAYSTPIYINAQLPPNLAQQQVNPLALPGFSLPTGQNGLFRLSGQGTGTPTASGPDSWTMGGASISPINRQQTLTDTKPRDIQLANGTQVSASAVDLKTVNHQASAAGAGASALDVSAPGADANTAGLPGRSTSFTINRVQGVPADNRPSNAHKYLIETNPVLTDLKQFMGSDYLLSNLGYDPDQSAKRLGDGLYEQRLIQQAVVARTGQRFIDGQTSDESMFKYLMDNALTSKNQLNLSLGVTLTAEQVAALTHDIVWMENVVVNGEQVLVPVLYLANANNRLAANGALIQGNDVTLIAGKDLDNVGTLRAKNNLSATAENNLVNSGLVEAGNRLDLLAGNNLVNKAGGIISGRDVTLTATRGDVINERSVTTHESGTGSMNERSDFVSSAARIEAANNLTLKAGQDVLNTGGVLKSGVDTTINAGRDVKLVSAEQEINTQRGLHHNENVTQYGSSVDVGRSLNATAGRDLTVIASQIDAKRDVSMSAVGDLTIASAADEQHAYGANKKFVSQEDHVSQVSSTINAGGNVSLSASKDLDLIASRVSAGGEAFVYAGNDLTLATAANTDYSYYTKTKKGSMGKKSSTMTESGSEEAVSSVIQSSGKSTLVAANDINIEGSKVNSDEGALRVMAGNDVNLTAAQNSAFSASSKSKSGGLGLSSTSKASSDSSSSTWLTGSSLGGLTTTIQAGHDLLVSASNVVSTNQTTLQARNDIRIESDVETFSSEHSQSTKKTGLMSSGGIGVTLGSSKNTVTQSSQSQTQKGSTVGSVLGDVSITAGKNLTIQASDVIAGGDISLAAQNVSILAAQNESTSKQTQESKKSGLTLALSGVVGEAVNTAYQAAQTARTEQDTRLAALQGVKAGLSGYQAYQAAQALSSGAEAGSFAGISLSLGTQKSSSTQVQEQSVSQGSSLTAGNNLSIIATGSGAAGFADGDITIQGSKLQAGNNMAVVANRDVNLIAAANTQKVEGSNSSGGGAVGISLGVGSSGAGLSIFANGNKGVGKETGNGTTWTETTLDAGNQLKIGSGRDSNLIGAQANAQQVVADVGRNLTLTSLQDTDRYDSKQTNVSGGASFTFGSMTGGGSVSVSQDKIKSNFDSVQEQTGLYAGKGGFQVNVGGHTQLNGSVIASTADSSKNTLSTGTLGWADIDNKADFTSQHQGVSATTSGGMESLLGTVGSLVGANNSGHASSTTHSAVSGATLLIRDQGSQQQDVSTLSRDVDNANNALSPIFNKEKEQQRLRQAQLIGEIGTQTMDIIRTQGMIEASKAAVAELTPEQRAMPGANPNASYADRQAYIAVLQSTNAYKNTMNVYGTGGSFQQAAQAVTAAVQGLAGGNIGQALAGASAPYLAETIKKMTVGNEEARIMAHAVLGALTASVQGGSAAGGAAGAAISAGGTELIMKALYGTTDVTKLSDSQKQTISALVTLTSGISGGLIGGDVASAIAAAQAGKNTAENNDMFSLPAGAAAASLYNYAIDNGFTQKQIADAFEKERNGIGFDGAMPGNALVQSWTVMMTGPMLASELTAGFAAMALGGAISGGANSAYQIQKGDSFSYSDAFIAAIVGAATQGKGFGVTLTGGLGGAYVGSVIKGEDPTTSLVGTAVGTTIGFKGGPIISNGLKPLVGETSATVIGNTAGAGVSEVITDKVNTFWNKK